MQLGIILAPYGHVPNAWPTEIGYGYGGGGTYLCPTDAQYHTRGEYGYYHDTPLGHAAARPGLLKRIKAKLGLGSSIPSDFELGTIYGYTPFNNGWIATKEGYYSGPWVPPNGYRPGGKQYGPKTWPLGDAGPTANVMQVSTAQDVIDVMNEQNSKIFTLTLIGTIASATAALLMAYRSARAMKRE